MHIKDPVLWYAHETSPFSIEFARKTEPYTMPLEHFHPQYEIYYLLSGERYYFIGDHTYHIQSGDLVFIKSQEVHRTSEATIPKHERVVFYFFESFIHEHYREHVPLLLRPFHEDNPVYRFKGKDFLQVESLLHNMLVELQTRPAGYEIRMKMTLIDLLLLAARHTTKLETTLLPLQSLLHEKITEISRYIRMNVTEDLSLSSLAEKFYMSPYYLSHTFKELTAFTLTEYVQTVRIRQAQRLLKETNMSILDISIQVGFENFSHFGKVFKKVTQQSPRQYRKE